MILNSNQIEMQYGIENYHNWIHVACRRAGKTTGAANIIKNTLLKPNQTILAMCPNTPMKMGLYNVVLSMIPDTLVKKKIESACKLELRNNSSLYFQKPNPPGAYLDFWKAPDLAVFEEMCDENYNDVLSHMELMRVKCLVTATPKNIIIPQTQEEILAGIEPVKTQLYKLWEKSQDVLNTSWFGKKYSWKDVEIWAGQSKHIRDMQKMLTKNDFINEFEGDFIDN